MAARGRISDFELANRIYAGATVSVKKASDDSLATLYAGSSGAGALSNPQRLDNDGQFVQPVYVEDAFYCTVSGLSVGTHDTGVTPQPETFSLQNLSSPVVSTIAALRALSGVALTGFVTVLGAVTAGDSKGGFYWWNAADTAADNGGADGGTVIRPDSLPATGRWNQIKDAIQTGNDAFARSARMKSRDVVSLADFKNADGTQILPDDGVKDQGLGIQNAIYFAGAVLTSAILAVPGGVYGFTEPEAGFGLYANVSAQVRGAGRNKTVFKNLSDDGWGFRSNAPGSGYYDFTLDQNGSTGPGITLYGMYSALRRVEVKNQGGTNYAIELDGCSMSVVDDVQVHTSTYGVRCGKTIPLNHLTANSVLIETNEGTALHINSSIGLVFTKLEIEPANAATNIKKQIYAFNSRRLDFIGFGYEDGATNVLDDGAYFEFENCVGVSFKGGGVTHAGSASKSLFQLSSDGLNENYTWTAENIHITSTKTGMKLFEFATVSHYGIALRDIVTTLTATAVGVLCGSAMQGLTIENWKDQNQVSTMVIDAVDFKCDDVPCDIALTSRARQVLTNYSGVLTGSGASTCVMTPEPTEILTASGAASVRGLSQINTAGGAGAYTLANGGLAGAIKIFEMITDGGDAVLTVAGHSTSSPEVFTFAEVGDILVLMWSGVVWVTLVNVGVAV